MMQLIQNYQIQTVLGQNHNQGRITYRAINTENNREVVIKQFLFATKNSQWSGYKSLEKEIKILQKLAHPRIPKYIEQFDSSNGMCLVQEYIPVDNCENQKLSALEVWLLAEQILEILIYLEFYNLVHKDIKPANILWDKINHQAYLVDFGMSSFSHSSNTSSTLSGTIGFMAPEQLFRGEISFQGDLYSLGATLYVLLAQISSNELPARLDSRWQIPITSLKNKFAEPLINWLKNLLATDKQYRFSSPQIALDEFKFIQSKKYVIERVTPQKKAPIEIKLERDLVYLAILLPLIAIATIVFPVVTLLCFGTIVISGFCILVIPDIFSKIRSREFHNSLSNTLLTIVIFLEFVAILGLFM